MASRKRRRPTKSSTSNDTSDDGENSPQPSTSTKSVLCCPICKAEVEGSYSEWKDHWKVHDKKRNPRKCWYCDREFRTKRSLLNHMHNDHGSNSSSMSSSSEDDTTTKNPFIQDECEAESGENSPKEFSSRDSTEGEDSDIPERPDTPVRVIDGPAYAVVPGPKLSTIMRSLTDQSIDIFADIPNDFLAQQDEFIEPHKPTQPDKSNTDTTRPVPPRSMALSNTECASLANYPTSPEVIQEEENSVDPLIQHLPGVHFETKRGAVVPNENAEEVDDEDGDDDDEEKEQETESDQADDSEPEERQDVSENIPTQKDTGKIRNLIGLVPFANMSHIMSFFACLATLKICERRGKPLCYIQYYKKEAKSLMTTAQNKYGDHLTIRDRINMRLVPSLGRLFKLSIHIYIENKDQLTRQESIDNKLPVLRLLLTEQGHFCLIKELRIFLCLNDCPDCGINFFDNRGLRRHITNNSCPYKRFMEAFPTADRMDFLATDPSEYMVKNIFRGGKTLPKIDIPQRLENFGIIVPDDLDLNEYVCISDTESYLHQASHKDPDGEDIESVLAIRGHSEILFSNTHKTCCVSIVSNINEKDYSTSKCFMDLNGSIEFLEHYVHYLNEMSDVAYEKCLVRHKDLLEEIRETRKTFERKNKAALVRQVEKLEADMDKQMRQLIVGWYNMTYDMQCLIRERGFAWILTKIDGCVPKALKNINKWLVLSTSKLKFLDICNFASGKCPLSDFLHSFDVPDHAGKLYFAYSQVGQPQDMWKQLPDGLPYSSFYSDIKAENVLEINHRKFNELLTKGLDEKEALKHLRKTAIPRNGAVEYEQLVALWTTKNMKFIWHYLSLYANMDTLALLIAVLKMKQSFIDLDNIKMFNFCTLPSLSYNFAIKHIADWETDDEGMKFFTKLDETSYNLVVKGIMGGSSCVLKRLSLVDFTKIKSHQVAPERQQTVKNISYLDFNMLYGSTAFSPMPVLGNFMTREKSENFAVETVNGRGWMALSWLQWQSRVIQQKPMRTILHANSEMTLMLKGHGRARLDGFIITGKDSKNRFIGRSYEFHGSIVHSSPYVLSKEEFEHGFNPLNGKPNKQVYEETLARDKLISEHELVVEHTVMWEHEWRQLIRTDPQIKYFVEHNTKSFAPDPVKHEMTWQELLQLICDQRVHGIVQCSVHVPDHLLPKFSIYPPLWSHRMLDRSTCCETERQYAEKHNLLQTPTKTLCNEMSATDCVLTTDFLRFYIQELELTCSDISVFIQFRGAGRPLLDWAEKCIAHREAARLNNQPIKGKMAKAMLNSFFGTSILKAEKRRNVSFVEEKKVGRYTNRPGFDGMYVAGPPGQKDLMYEIEMKKMTILQSSSKQCGMFILQKSKEKLLDFIYNTAYKYFEDECWEINATDTDSILLSTSTEGRLTEITKPHLREELDQKYDQIFATKPEHAHVPLLLKSEKEAKVFIGLSSKCYFMAGNDPFHKQASKGITASKENEEIVSVFNYLTTLFDISKERKKATLRGIRNDRSKTLCTYAMTKSGLARLAPKIGFHSCCICPFPLDLKDRPEILAQIYPYSCTGVDFASAWAKIRELALLYPEMHLNLE